MKRIATLWKSALLAAATVTALGFGAAQAFAAPPSAEADKACSTWSCRECGPLGGQWVPSAGKCYCCG